MSSRAEILEQRVALLVTELGLILELEHELTPLARRALLAVCSDAAGMLERDELARSRTLQ